MVVNNKKIYNIYKMKSDNLHKYFLKRTINNLNNFNYFEYINNYNDLTFMNENEAKYHYIKYGIFENRTFKTNNLDNFNYKSYLSKYDDLKHMNEYEAKLHYIRYGKYENRTFKLDFKNLNHILYINPDTESNINIVYTNIFSNNNTLAHIKAISYLKYLEGNNFLIIEKKINIDNINFELMDEFDILLIKENNNRYEKWNTNIKYDNNYIINRRCLDKIFKLIEYDFIERKYNNNIEIDIIFSNLETWIMV
jgi:hypothetical protein